MFKLIRTLRAMYLNAHGVDADTQPVVLTDAQRAHNSAVAARLLELRMMGAE